MELIKFLHINSLLHAFLNVYVASRFFQRFAQMSNFMYVGIFLYNTSPNRPRNWMLPWPLA
jgi:hypothetical protein